MSVPCSRGWVNYFQNHEVIFSKAFLGGVLGKMGAFREIWMDKTWCVAGKNVVKLMVVLWHGEHANFLK
jgi:hypothetical protein